MFIHKKKLNLLYHYRGFVLKLSSFFSTNIYNLWLLDEKSYLQSSNSFALPQTKSS